jgi:short-subunit dehydrogenase
MADRKTALITGASGGLGLEFAKLFAKDGHDVALVARRRDRLEEIAAALARDFGIKASVFPADLTDPAAPKQIYDQVTAAALSIEFLVNNAGFGSTGPFVDSDLGRELGMIECNVKAPVHLTRLFLPAMVERKSGRILNVGSSAGFLPGPFMATYYASKAFVGSFTEALAHELRGTGVTATLSAPGATATEFAAVAGNDKSALFQSGVADAATVALHAYRAMLAGKVLAIPGVKNKLTLQVLRVSPRSMARTIAARLNQPRA